MMSSSLVAMISCVSDLCMDCVRDLNYFPAGTGISGLMRGLATLPPRWIQEPSVIRNRDWQCTASVCVAEVHCWEISFG